MLHNNPVMPFRLTVTDVAEEIFYYPFDYVDLFDGKYIRESGNVKYFHNIGANITDNHFALLVHRLLSRKENAESGGRNVFELFKVEYEFGYSVKRLTKLCFELGSSGGVESSYDRNRKYGSVKSFF